MIVAFDSLMSTRNLSCWIDYGTLLGSYRKGTVIDYDHDGDIGYLLSDINMVSGMVAPLLTEQYNISINVYNPVQMTFNGTKVDLFVYGTYESLHIPIPDGKTSETLTRHFYRNSDFMEQTYSDVEPEWLFPLSKCPFEGQQVSCPNQIEKILSTRYPYSYKYNLIVPFKFWCYANPVSFFKIVFYY